MKSTVHEFYERKMAEIFDSNLSDSTKAKILKLLSDDIKRTSCVGGIKTCVYSSSNENCFYCNKLNKDMLSIIPAIRLKIIPNKLLLIISLNNT